MPAGGTRTRRRTSRGMNLEQELITWVVGLGELGVPAHLRRARRLLRPRCAAAGRRIRTGNPRADVGDLAVGEARSSRADGLRALLDAQAARAAVRAGAGPPAPPRDRRSDIGDLLECFTF